MANESYTEAEALELKEYFKRYEFEEDDRIGNFLIMKTYNKIRNLLQWIQEREEFFDKDPEKARKKINDKVFELAFGYVAKK